MTVVGLKAVLVIRLHREVVLCCIGIREACPSIRGPRAASQRLSRQETVAPDREALRLRWPPLLLRLPY